MIVLVGRIFIHHIEDIQLGGGIGELAVGDVLTPGQLQQAAAVPLRFQQYDLHILLGQPPGQRLRAHRLPLPGTA